MKSILNLSLLCLLVLAPAMPQRVAADTVVTAERNTDANVYGHVIDKKTGEHLPYIRVTVKGTTLAAMTDATGHYFLKNLPVGRITLEVGAIGYRTQQREVTTSAGHTRELNFELEESDVALDEVVVSANRSETRRREAPNLVSASAPSSLRPPSPPASCRG